MKKLIRRLKIFWMRVCNTLSMPKRYKITPRGEYVCAYIIDKYLNETRPDNYNESYEEIVEKSLARIEATDFFESFYNSNGEAAQIEAKDRRDFAAAMSIVGILACLSKEDREHVLNQIDDEKIRGFISRCVKMGMLF